MEREKIRGLFGKYIPEQIAEQLLATEDSLEPQNSSSSIIFVDLAGFTSLSERMKPEEIIKLLNEYFSDILLTSDVSNFLNRQFLPITEYKLIYLLYF